MWMSASQSLSISTCLCSVFWFPVSALVWTGLKMEGEVSFISLPLTACLPLCTVPLHQHPGHDWCFIQERWALGIRCGGRGGGRGAEVSSGQKGKFCRAAVTSAVRNQPWQVPRSDAFVALLLHQCEACVVWWRLLTRLIASSSHNSIL